MPLTLTLLQPCDTQLCGKYKLPGQAFSQTEQGQGESLQTCHVHNPRADPVEHTSTAAD